MKIYKNPKKSISQKKKKEKTVDLDHMKTVLLIERFQEIRRKRLQKERKEREEQKKRNDASQWHPSVSKDEVLGYQFRRNPFEEKKNMLNKFDFKKHKMQIENANRNMEKNRVNNALKAVTLHFVDVKSKLHLKDDDDLNILKEKIKRKQKKIHTKRNITNNYNDYRPKTSKINIEKNNTFNQLKIQNYTKDAINKKKKIYPQKNNKTYNTVLSLTNSYNNISNTENSYNILKKRRPISTSPNNSVQNKPIYTTDIKVFYDDYNRIKDKMVYENIKFRKRHLMDDDTINDIMNIRSEMLFFCLKNKYINCKFPKYTIEKKKKPQIDVFIDKLINQCQQMDFELNN